MIKSSPSELFYYVLSLPFFFHPAKNFNIILYLRTIFQKIKKIEFIAENDTCRITYNFCGEKGPIHISIYNKTNKPLQVDWKKSAVIFGENAVSYFTSESKINGEIEKTFYKG